MIIRATRQTKLACGALMLIIINVCFLIAIIALISKEIMCKVYKTHKVHPPTIFPEPLEIGDFDKKNLRISKTPWLLSFITVPEHTLIGGATIISKNWALTSAYCAEKVSHFPLSSIGFRGGSSFWNKDGHYHYAVKMIPHYNFDPLTLDFNLALVEVVPAFLNENESPILIARKLITNVNEVMSSAKIIGWATINMNSIFNEYIIQGTVDIVSNKMCEPNGKRINNNNDLSILICGNNFKCQDYNNCSFVHGTSLVKNNSLIGLTSWGAIYNDRKWPGVYVDISIMIDWINKIQLQDQILLQ